MRRLLAGLCALLAFAHAAVAAPRGGGSPIPPQAAAVGYKTLTFSQDAFSTSNVDTTKSYASGFSWYVYNWFGSNNAASTIALNADGSLTEKGGPTGLVSAAPIAGSPGYVGTAFGGGAYLEATFSFDPATISGGLQWPAWWGMSVEHVSPYMEANGADQWSGQASNFLHFIEHDFFEASRPSFDSFGFTLHDWYGLYVNNSYSVYSSDYTVGTKQPSAGNDWRVYHRVGELWVPATASTSGYAQSYVDDIPLGPPVTWTQFTNQAPPPSASTSWAFGAIDSQHLALVLSTGVTAFTIRSVKVWQASAANNLTH